MPERTSDAHCVVGIWRFSACSPHYKHEVDAKESLGFVFCRARDTPGHGGQQGGHPCRELTRSKVTAHGTSCHQLKRAWNIVELVAAQCVTTPYEIRRSESVGTGSPGSVCHVRAWPNCCRFTETSVPFVRSELECVDREEQRSSVALCTAFYQKWTHSLSRDRASDSELLTGPYALPW